MISARALHKQYQDGSGAQVPVLQGVDLEVAAGEFVVVVGASGSGKSTLLHVLGGLDADFTGEVTVAGARVNGRSDRELARFRNKVVGFVFQSFHLVPNLSALDNVQLPGFFAPQGEGSAGAQRAQALLARVGLGDRGHRPPSQLSGGERQRVAIARALFHRPRVLLCDEPTGNLDTATGGEVISLFQQLHQEGLTLLVVTHEQRVSQAAQRVLRLEAGQLREEGAR